MNRTKIEWCDYTWNPIVGCSPCSDGCQHCYAQTLAKRFHWPWGHAAFWPHRLDEPAKTKAPGRVFVCSMGDLGHETVLESWRLEIYAAMARAPWHQYIILTKRPGPWLAKVPDNVWVGVTIESQKYFPRWLRLVEFAPTAALKFVSVEPMLGPVRFSGLVGPEWVIAGPETGEGARPCQPEWFHYLNSAHRYFFDKRKDDWLARDWPAPHPSEGADHA